MDGLLQDLLRSLRSLARQPFLALVVVLTLAVGLGASTAMFSFFREVWTDRYYQGPDDGRAFYVRPGTREEPGFAVSYPDYLDYRQGTKDLGEMVGWVFFSAIGSLEDAGGRPERTFFVLGEAVQSGHFRIFNAPAMAYGRGFVPDDERPGSEVAVVLGHAFWRRELGGDPSVVGRTLRLNGQPCTIVGIAPQGFLGQGMSHHLYVPLAQSDLLRSSPVLADRDASIVSALLVLHDGVERSAAEGRLARIAEQLDREASLPNGERRSLFLRGVREDVGASLDGGDAMLLAAVTLLLVLAAVNVANLLLVRAAGRRREMAIFAALGAPRGRIVRRLLAESVVLALLGGVLGTVLAQFVNAWLGRQLRITPTGLGAWSADVDFMPIDGPVWLFVLGLSALTGVLFGLAPVLFTLRADLVAALKGTGAGERPGRGRHALVVVQVAISTSLLVGAGLLSQSLLRLERIDPGYETEHLLIAAVRAIPQNGADDAAVREATRRLYVQARDAVAALPGVEQAALAAEIPGTSGIKSARLVLPELPDEKPEIARAIVDPAFFETLRIKVLQGRGFDDRDRAGAPGVVLVNEAFAAKYWPGVPDVLGRTLGLEGLPPLDGAGESLRVVGLVRDTRHVSRKQASSPLVYLPFGQLFKVNMAVVARTSGPPRRMTGAVRRALSRVDPDLTVVEVDVHRRHLEFDLYLEVIFERLARLFGLLGLGLAAAGIYSVMSCLTSYRMRELGIRMAMGATADGVVRLVLRGAMVLVAAGVAGGLLGSLWLAKFVEKLLYGVGTADPLTFGAVASVLGLVGLLAAYVPARRAGRVDPLKVLREE